MVLVRRREGYPESTGRSPECAGYLEAATTGADVDLGRLLWIPTSKTEAGRRTLRVPDALRPYLQRLASDRKPADLLFGEHWRNWPRQWVQRICRAAEVPVVCAHSMRGLHSTLAMDAGVTGHVVAASLGHESVSTTIQSYAKAEAVTNAAQQRTLTVLSGGLV
jgi:integrase